MATSRVLHFPIISQKHRNKIQNFRLKLPLSKNYLKINLRHNIFDKIITEH